MPAWLNRTPQDTSVYEWELYCKWPHSLIKMYICKKTGRTAISEALPKNEGNKIFVLIADEWKQDKTKEVQEMIENDKICKDIIT